jgi:alpha-tubulin suppressor-like RCC1 family protein
MNRKHIPLILILALLSNLWLSGSSVGQTSTSQPDPTDWIDDGTADGRRDAPSNPNWYDLPDTAFTPPVEGLPAQAIVQTAAGLAHTCALSDAGGVKCWGDNWEGKLGNGSVISSNFPVDVYGLETGVASISGTHKHTCALTSAGGVQCWGRNWHGELGDGTTDYRVTPVTPQGLESGVAAVAAGGFHTCALMLDGSIRCWGANWHGQVGDGTDVEKHTPVQVIELEVKAVAIATGKYHTCAVLETGGLRCWGYNKFGQLGNGPDEDKWIPTRVDGLSEGVADVALGENHSCALLVKDQVMCWGNNAQGQVGIGSTDTQYIPIFVPGMASNAKAIYTGQRFSCAFAISGGAYCWGENWAGQLGDGSQEDKLTPVAVNGLDANILDLATGDSHACAVLDTGGVKCWGSNGYGQLGDGEAALRTSPVQVYGLSSGFTAVVSGGMHACGLSAAGGVYCWGSNRFGQLGDNTLVSRTSPVPVYGLSQGVLELAAGSNHTCARTASQVFCWGYNSYGQLGSGNRYDSAFPLAVLGITHPAIKLTTGTNHACIIQDNGTIKCWGYNRNGQLGNGSRDDATSAKALEGVTGIDFVDVSAGDRHSCAVTSTGGAMCWGLNVYGQLGDGTIELKTTPVDVIGLDQAALELELGDDHSCVIVEDSSLRCWGSNVNGQLGDGTTYDEWHPVATIGLGGSVAALSAGSQQTCAQLEGSMAVQCWGDNQSGQLGDGTTITKLTPVYVPGLNAGWLGSGSLSTCAVTTTGAVQCWGSNAQGQVGDGSLPWRLVPSLVKKLVAAKLEINYSDGAPGSYFTIRGTNFYAWNEVSLRINNIPLSPSLQSDSNGNLLLIMDAAQAEAGGYVVSVEAGERRNASLHIDMGAPVHAQEDSGPIYQIPGESALTWAVYLPWGAK